MSFKENTLKKIQINRLAQKILPSIGAPDNAQKLDKETMRALLAKSPYTYQKERDLDLYLEKIGDQSNILVLDNELPIYHTTVEDVALRKSPYIKEMANIGNIIKILKDSDVKLSIKADSLKTVQTKSIALLDLSYTRSDIEALVQESSAALENRYAEGVKENLSIFAEILGYHPPPKAFHLRHHELFGALTTREAGEMQYGPIVLYSLIDNSLKLIDAQISNFDKKKMEFFQQVAAGKERASVEGAETFEYLKKAVFINDGGEDHRQKA